MYQLPPPPGCKRYQKTPQNVPQKPPEFLLIHFRTYLTQFGEVCGTIGGGGSFGTKRGGGTKRVFFRTIWGFFGTSRGVLWYNSGGFQYTSRGF